MHLQQLVFSDLRRVRDHVDHESSLVVDQATDDKRDKSDDDDEVVLALVLLVRAGRARAPSVGYRLVKIAVLDGCLIPASKEVRHVTTFDV
jgi:hypothetical protein